ncbi:hypothetical protein TWF694_008888 [Orbilia ellipsospora]|uniref:Uncharacterized protein n=1 Tax=Orbilia ellipsospora TaxID=2528407 RepID=A0AAV9XDS9_9PEZI
MHFTTLLLPLLSLASSINASPLGLPEDHTLSARATTGAFQISDFYNSGIPHSAQAYLSLTVKDPATKLTATCYVTQAILPSIATAIFPTKCSVPGVAFGLEYYQGLGYVLTILHKWNRDQNTDMGIIWMGTDVQTRVDPFNPNGNVQFLNYSSNFTVPYSRYIQLKKST